MVSPDKFRKEKEEYSKLTKNSMYTILIVYLCSILLRLLQSKAVHRETKF